MRMGNRATRRQGMSSEGMQPPERKPISAFRRRRKSTPNRSGAAAVEMAMVSPFIVLLILSAFEFSRMLMVKQALDNVARESCRQATLALTLNSDDADSLLRERLNAIIVHSIDPDIVRVSIEPEFTSGIPSGQSISVNVEVDCDDISWLPAAFFAGAKIRSSCISQRE
ncbi:MAG: TadE/TadG family type IV pilus assembly protein [Pirellulaceae bacterium]